jgi:hypothetical protein
VIAAGLSQLYRLARLHFLQGIEQSGNVRTQVLEIVRFRNDGYAIRKLGMFC